jgi:hypothetical protein
MATLRHSRAGRPVNNIVDRPGSIAFRIKVGTARHVIVSVSLEHLKVDELAFAPDFKQTMNRQLHNGNQPVDVDLSVYVFSRTVAGPSTPLLPILLSNRLTQWVDAINHLAQLDPIAFTGLSG